ncbi:MAG: type II toxin-antitoxin system Phd/YefM family antitoxin [Hyphomicrobiaceae bacterium]
MTTIVTSREFNQDVGRAKRAAEDGPVVVTDRGIPAYVLLNYEDYQRLVGKGASILDLLGQSGAADDDMELPRLGSMQRPADLD